MARCLIRRLAKLFASQPCCHQVGRPANSWLVLGCFLVGSWSVLGVMGGIYLSKPARQADGSLASSLGPVGVGLLDVVFGQVFRARVPQKSRRRS